jgi:ApaG protein|tara:strand:+ start:496 stop:867 length:372 start_codon:yes stop_codon:yes gene_type:complete
MKNNIEILTRPDYLPDRSDPIKSYYFFSYQIKIVNRSVETIQLLSRYWHIVDGQGRAEDIYGPGVVGKTPILKPNDLFEYTSFCPLPTPLGFMEGSYRMLDESGKEFDVPIERFQLVAPQVLN